MDSPDAVDSPVYDRNPSPPPELAENSEILSAECIGNTAFSKHWLFTTLIKLIEEVNHENESESDLAVDVDDDLQNELCKLWDMSMNTEVAVFLDEFKALEIMTGIIEKSKAPRVIEICVGILGNMACEQTVCRKMAENHKFIDLILLMMETRDVPTLVENTRLVYTSLTNTGSRGPWIKAVQRSEDILNHLKFIFSSSTNCDLLKNTAEIVDTLLDLEPDLCVSWATVDFIHSLLEATEQIGSNHSEAMEVYLHIFQSFSTTEPGVEALVSHIDRLETKILKYLNIVCEYEIVGVDGKEQALSSAISVLHILFTTRPPDKLTHLCNNEKLIRILLKILEPLYPMLQNLKEAKKLHSKDQSDPQTDDHVTSNDQSDSKNVSHDKNEPNDENEPKDAGINQKDTEVVTGFSEEEEAELQQLTVLYDILSGYVLDYTDIVFMESTKQKQKPDATTETMNSVDQSCDDDTGAKGDNCDSTSREDNSSKDVKETNHIENCTGDSENESRENENENNDSAIDCVAILTYLDDSCSRWRINYFGLTLRKSEQGALVYRKICDLAHAHQKERLSRILKDIEEGKIVTRAESTKDLPEEYVS